MLSFPQAGYDEIRKHGEETYPHECCGVLLGQFSGEDRVVETTVRCGNTRTDSPQNRYHIAPQELVRVQRQAREKGLEIIGFYHSHPDHPAQPSSTDLAEAHWIGCSYVITSVQQGKAALTNSFVLGGGDEDDKHFEQEQVSIGETNSNEAVAVNILKKTADG